MWNVISLDGYFEGKNAWDLDFHNLAWGKELEDFILVQLRSADMLVFGASTYKGMEEYWTNAGEEESEIAKIMNGIQKVVCSSTLKSATWKNTTIVKSAVREIPKLKKDGSGNMFVFGSGKLTQTLMKACLFDEYRLCVAPVFLGHGRRLFENGIPYQKLTLLEALPLKTGGIILKYKPLG